MKAKTIFYPAPDVPFSRDEIAAIFAQFGTNDPIMAALRQILAQRLAAATMDCTDPHLTERTAGMAAGRIAEIADIQQEFSGYLNAGRELKRQGIKP